MKALLMLVLLAACGPTPVPQPSIHERCQASTNPYACEVIGQNVEAQMELEQRQQQPVIIYQQPAWQSRPAVVLPYQNPMGYRLQQGVAPGSYYLPGHPMFTVQPLP